MLSSSPYVNYISGVPFNLTVSEKLFGLKVPFWYYNVSESDRGILKKQLADAINNRG